MAERLPGDKPKDCDDLVIECMENRFHEANREYMQDSHGLDIDEVVRLALAGSSLAVADGTLIPQIEKAHKLKGVKNVYIFDHTDCGGFGGLEAFGGSEHEEAEIHLESLAKATKALHEVMPHLVVITKLIGLDGKEIVGEPEIARGYAELLNR